MNDSVAMAKAIDALRPWRDKIVIVGGWAHRLHRQHPDAAALTYDPILTLDADVAFATPNELQGDIGAALKQAGFDRILLGDHVPPVSHYEFGENNTGFFVEFLTPLRGRPTRRDGSEDATTAAAGVTAQKLRHLEVLLTESWKIALVPSRPLPVAEDTYLRVANPVSFIVQKLLIHHHRVGGKKAQDLLYVHDTLQLFESNLPTLSNLWEERIRPSLSEPDRKETMARATQLFQRVSDPIRDAVRIPVGRRINPEEFRLRCLFGLEQLLQTASR